MNEITVALIFGVLVILIGGFWIVYTSSMKIHDMNQQASEMFGRERMQDAVLSPEDKAILMKSCKNVKFIVTNPNDRLQKRVSDSFQYVSWDGGHWVATIVGDTFYIRKMGSSRIFKTKFINVLRFRSSHWQVAYLPKEKKFMVSRLNGITGMLFKDLDLFDWGYHSYIVTPVDEQ